MINVGSVIAFLTITILGHANVAYSACVSAQCKNLRKQQLLNLQKGSSSSGSTECPPFYLIPGKAIDCSNSNYGTRVMSIDPSSVRISPNPVKLPGCFTIQMDVKMLPLPTEYPRSFVSKIEFNWWNLPQFSALPCQNQSNNGCGGYGNNCYYCDVCNSLEQLHMDESVAKDKLGKQFADISCPTKPGTYSLTRQFCFNDFNDFDKDGDCQFDFLQEDGLAKQYKDALKNLQQVGYLEIANNGYFPNEMQKKLKSRDAEKIEVEGCKKLILILKCLENFFEKA